MNDLTCIMTHSVPRIDIIEKSAFHFHKPLCLCGLCEKSFFRKTFLGILMRCPKCYQMGSDSLYRAKEVQLALTKGES